MALEGIRDPLPAPAGTANRRADSCPGNIPSVAVPTRSSGRIWSASPLEPPSSSHVVTAKCSYGDEARSTKPLR